MNEKFNYKEMLFEHLRKNKQCCYINEIYLMTIIDFIQLPSEKFLFFKTYIFFLFSTILSGTILFYNLLFEKKINYNSEIGIARVNIERNKIAKICGEIQFIGDDIKKRDFTIYQIGTRTDRLLFLMKFYFKYCLHDFNEIKKILNSGLFFDKSMLLWCAKRIPHAVVFKNAIKIIMTNYKLSTVYIGATHERFALIVSELAERYGKKLICIPHGVESPEKMPGGYVGDIFYCSSSMMAFKLNQVYNTSKFVFDVDVTKKIYHINNTRINTPINGEIKVVFFTQPIYIKQSKEIIVTLAEYLKTKNKKLYLKVHPKESPIEYIFENTQIIGDFCDSIVGNICISMVSTILLEAIYNDSIPISIIYLGDASSELTGYIEFLSDDRIYKPKDENALIELINKFCR